MGGNRGGGFLVPLSNQQAGATRPPDAGGGCLSGPFWITDQGRQWQGRPYPCSAKTWLNKCRWRHVRGGRRPLAKSALKTAAGDLKVGSEPAQRWLRAAPSLGPRKDRIPPAGVARTTTPRRSVRQDNGVPLPAAARATARLMDQELQQQQHPTTPPPPNPPLPCSRPGGRPAQQTCPAAGGWTNATRKRALKLWGHGVRPRSALSVGPRTPLGISSVVVQVPGGQAHWPKLPTARRFGDLFPAAFFVHRT